MSDRSSNQLSRRSLLTATGVAVAATTLNTQHAHALDQGAQPPADFKTKNNRIKQSVMGWCFKPMPVEELIKHCAAIGLKAIEGVSTKFYPAAKKAGLEISLVGSHGFAKGPLDKGNHQMCLDKLKAGIDKAVEVGASSVITFTGMGTKGITDEQAAKNCVDLWKQVMPYAEKHKIDLVLEHLNSRDDTHPMKGHPGYFGDDVDFCVDLIKKVDSPNMKLLFDVYHVQMMNGDVIRRIKQYKDVIGHYHTAGNPGRGELDDTQEIYYPPIMKAIVETGYDRYVAQEFIPTWKDPVAALRHAAWVCDV